MAYIGGMYRVWVDTTNSEYSKLIDYIKTEQEARQIANAEWVKPYVKAVRITHNGFDSRKRRKSTTIAEAMKQ